MTVLATHTGSEGAGDAPGALGVLAGAMQALRRTTDTGTACRIAGDCAVRALGAAGWRLLGVDSRSQALRRIGEGGVESAWLAEPGGPVEWVLRHDAAWFDDGSEADPALAGREAALWDAPPAALAALPLVGGAALTGVLLIGFAAPRAFPAADRQLLALLADALAFALERAGLRREAEEERGRRLAVERRMNDAEATSASLMSLVAHEIRTPLTAIQAYTETLLQSLANPHTPRERFLGIINDECERLGRLVTDVLDLSRLEAGQRPLRLARFDLRALVDEVLEGSEAIARVRRLSFRVDVPPSLAVEADRDLLRRLIGNLLSNALRHSPPGGVIGVAVESGEEAWTLSVEDQGPGIAPEALPRLLARQPRAEPGGAPAGTGSGLGLAIAGGIVALHGGRLWAECPAGGGARIRFRLPLRQMASLIARRIARTMTSRPDVRQLFEDGIGMVAAVMDAGIVSVMLVDPERGDLFIAAARGLEAQNLSARRTAVRSGVAGTVAAWARPVLVNNIETDRRFQRLNHPQYTTKSLVSVPLLVEGEVLGVVNVNNKLSREPFDEHDLALLVAMVERLGGVVERAASRADGERVIADASDAVRAITALREPGLLGRPAQVRHARRLARELGLPEADVDRVGWAAVVRDLGMAPLHHRLDAVLGPLGEDDRRALAGHPAASVAGLRPLEYVGLVRELVLGHHEHWDGGGYPRGLRGEAIPPGARAIAVVDAWHSMIADRPWRPARSRAEALAELRRFAGSQFDPLVVDAFERVLASEAERA